MTVLRLITNSKLIGKAGSIVAHRTSDAKLIRKQKGKGDERLRMAKIEEGEIMI
jgi:hypothetical protein